MCCCISIRNVFIGKRLRQIGNENKLTTKEDYEMMYFWRKKVSESRIREELGIHRQIEKIFESGSKHSSGQGNSVYHICSRRFCNSSLLIQLSSFYVSKIFFKERKVPKNGYLWNLTKVLQKRMEELKTK